MFLRSLLTSTVHHTMKEKEHLDPDAFNLSAVFEVRHFEIRLHSVQSFAALFKKQLKLLL